MSDFFKRLGRVLAYGLITLALPSLVSCGGGGDGGVASGGVGSGGTGLAGGVGTGGTGFSIGTVLGFGSIVLDGDTYSSATAQYLASTSSAEAAQTSSTSLGIGKQVEITLDSSGNPTSVLELPAVTGAVTLVTGTPPTSFVVAGTTVVLNSDSTRGPVTYLDGLSSASAISTGQQLEVHGFYMVSGGSPYIQATRISLLKSTNTVTRLEGVISNYTSGHFTLGSTTVTTSSATVLPSGSTLANGQFVSVWSSSALSSNTVSANTIRVRSISTALGTVKVAGVVYGLSGTGFSVSGLQVDASASSLASTLAALQAGKYVVVTGQANASGVLVASLISTSVINLHQTEIKGSITNYVSRSNFQVRGVTVDASNATLSPSGATLQNGAYVDVTGVINNNVLSAASLTVSTPSSGNTVEYIGTLTGVTTNSITLLTQSGTTMTFTLASNRGYENGSSSNLSVNNRVLVEATYSGGVYTAYGVRFLVTSGSDSGSQGHSEVSGRVYNLSQSGTTYTFTVNNIQIQYTASGSINGLVNGASVDVYFTPGSPNIATSVSLDD